MKTYLIPKPETLNNLALDKLATCIVSQAKKLYIYQRRYNSSKALAEVSLQTEIFRKYLSDHLYPMYHDALLLKIINLLCPSSPTLLLNQLNDYDAKTFPLIESLFSKKITSLTLDLRQFYTFQNSFLPKSYLLKGLTYLDLDTSQLKDTLNVDDLIVALLLDLNVLKYLKISKICTNNILRCIAKHCKLITELNISDSEDINDNSMHIITDSLYNLTSINLKGTLVTCLGIKNILLKCVNIEYIFYLPTNRMNNITYILKQIVDSHDCPKLFKLKSYESIGDNFLILDSLANVCSLMQKLSIRALRQQNNFRVIENNLSNLRELTLESYDMNNEEVLYSLHNIGHQLEYLHLVETGAVDIYELLEICPNLNTLMLSNCTFKNHKLGYEPDTNNIFKNMKKILIDTSDSFDRSYYEYFRGTVMHVSSDLDVENIDVPLHFILNITLIQKILLFLLSNCVKVEFIELSRSVWFTEDLLLEILEVNSLAHLIELKICSYPTRCPVRPPLPITEAVITQIIRNCGLCPEIILEERT